MNKRLALILCVSVSLWLLVVVPAAAEKVTIYRDEYGVPHIYAETLQAASYASGYAQAEDRLEELLRNYRKAEGTMSEAFGEKWFRHDYRQRLWRHAAISREKYNEVSPLMRRVGEAYIAGVQRFMKEHPQQVPSWAPELHPWQVVALGRYIIWGWPEGDIGGDLRRGGIEPDRVDPGPPPYRGSNEWLVAPQRSALKAPIALVDPHLSWYGEFRFYEIRMYAGDFSVAGASILGLPFPNLGNTRWCSIAMTTGGPDTADVFEEELNPANPRQYRYDGQWRDMTVRKEKIGIRVGEKVEWKELEIESTHHGPVVAHKGGKAYAAAIPYFDQVGLMDQGYRMETAKNLEEMKQAMSMLQLMAQNIMVGTVQGDIFYVRNGRVPIRAPGANPGFPIPGNSSANEWKGIHPFSDLVQIANPPQGYMQNCNISPFGLMKDSPLTPEKYAHAPYLYNDSRRPNHQRAQMALELLDAEQNMTLEKAMDIAFSPMVYQAELWQARIKEAWDREAGSLKGSPAAAILDLIQRWNRRSDADSVGAMAFRSFKAALGKEWSPAVRPPANMTDAQVLDALVKAAKQLQEDYGTLEAPFGRLYRVGREGGSRTFPVGGGSLNEFGMATPRAISFSPVGKEMVGRSGQTSTQLVILSNPPKSFSVIPLGESDHLESGHWQDQAEKLFSQSKMKPTYFLDKKELLKHVTATKVLEWPAKR